MSLKKLFGGPYLASCVFDLSDTLATHYRTLSHMSGFSTEGYIGSLLEYAIWLAGKKVNALDPATPMVVPIMDVNLTDAVHRISVELESCIYRILSPLQYTEHGIVVLRPDRLVYRRGEVWLCWKTHDLY